VVYLRPAREGDVLTLECEVSFVFSSSFRSIVWGLVLETLFTGY
jgi:hypothetical protein